MGRVPALAQGLLFSNDMTLSSISFVRRGLARLLVGSLALGLVPGVARAGAGLSSAEQAARTFLERYPSGAKGPRRIGPHVVEHFRFAKGGFVYPEGREVVAVHSPPPGQTAQLPLDVARSWKLPQPGRSFVMRNFDIGPDGRLALESSRLTAGFRESNFERGKPVIVHEDWRPAQSQKMSRYSKQARAASGRFAVHGAAPTMTAASAPVKSPIAGDRALRPELERLAQAKGIAAGGPLPAWAMAAVVHLTDPAKIAAAGRLIMQAAPEQAGLILPFAIESAGKSFGVAAGSAAAWRSVLVEHGLAPSTP